MKKICVKMWVQFDICEVILMCNLVVWQCWVLFCIFLNYRLVCCVQCGGKVKGVVGQGVDWDEWMFILLCVV